MTFILTRQKKEPYFLYLSLENGIFTFPHIVQNQINVSWMHEQLSQIEQFKLFYRSS